MNKPNMRLIVEPDFIFVPRRATPKYKDIIAYHQDLVGIRGEGNYSRIVLASGQEILFSVTLLWWQKEFAKHDWPVVRASKQWIVNWLLVKEKLGQIPFASKHAGFQLRLANYPEPITVSRRAWKSLVELKPLSEYQSLSSITTI